MHPETASGLQEQSREKCIVLHWAKGCKQWVSGNALLARGSVSPITTAATKLLIFYLLKWPSGQDIGLPERKMGISVQLLLTDMILKCQRRYTNHLQTRMQPIAGFLKPWDLEDKWQKLNAIYTYANYLPVSEPWNAFESKYPTVLKFTEKLIPTFFTLNNRRFCFFFHFCLLNP